MTQLAPYRFDRSEVAGSMGDMGTLVPLAVAMIAVNRLDATAVLLGVGVFYIAAGLYYRLPVPVQPFKAIAAVAIAGGLSAECISAGGLLMAAILILLGATNLISVIARLFTKPIVRGIQLGLGMILIVKGGAFILGDKIFLSGFQPLTGMDSTLGLLLGGAGFIVVLILINNKKFPAAIVLVAGGIIAAAAFGATGAMEPLRLGFRVPQIAIPSLGTFWPALMLLALPQLPLTIGNAVISTRDTSQKLFGAGAAARVTDRALCFSMGLANIVIGFFGGMPCCHGAGGLAAHYRFGARTGGSNIIIGAAFIALALILGASAMQILSLIPLPILGVLLCFAGIELCLMIVDISDRTSLFVTLVIAGLALVTRNMGVAFIAGVIVDQIIKLLKITLDTGNK